VKRLILLTGLVSVEKVSLTLDLTAYYQSRGHSVSVIDNITRLHIDPGRLHVEKLIQHPGDILGALPGLLESLPGEIIIAAVSEMVPPLSLFATLDDITEAYALHTQTIALIDLRTCDCFPQIRELLETYADVAVYLPYQLESVLAALNETSTESGSCC
jgi:hypothetical protein